MDLHVSLDNSILCMNPRVLWGLPSTIRAVKAGANWRRLKLLPRLVAHCFCLALCLSVISVLW